MYTPDMLNWIWLSSAEGMTAPRFYRLITEFGSAGAVREHIDKVLPIVGERTHAHLRRSSEAEWAERFVETMHRMGMRAIPRTSQRYPEALAAIHDPPAVLYVRGALEPLDHAVAIVGSRRCSLYGRGAGHRLGKELGAVGAQVVSGMALGVDGSAHEGALDAQGRTVAVLGCGVDMPYPQENARLMERILAEGGAVVSEYPPGTQALAHHFPARNRIIAGLSQGVILVEGGRRSGAMITVRYALEEGREVLAVPGPIDSPLSVQPNEMIAQGACLVRGASDVATALGWDIGQPEGPASPIAKPTLEPREERLVALLRDGPLSFEEILEGGGFAPAELNSLLTTLEIRRIMKQLPGRMFQLT